MINLEFINLSVGMNYKTNSYSDGMKDSKLWNSPKFQKKWKKAKNGMYNCKSIKQFHKADQKFCELLKELRLESQNNAK